MHLITFGTDEHILDKNSRQFDRILSYAKNVDGYTAVVFSRKVRQFKIEDCGPLRLVHVPRRTVIRNLHTVYNTLKTNVHTDTVISSQDPFEIGFLAYMYAKFLHRPLHIQVHTSIESPYFRGESIRNRVQYYISCFVLKRARAIRVVSNRIKTFLIQSLSIPEHKIDVAPIYAGDLEVVNVSSSGSQKENSILMMSRIEKVKNISLGVEAFLELIKKEQYKDYVLEIVGEGTQKAYLQEKYKMHTNIIWKPWASNPATEYLRAKVFLLTSWYEGWGMTPIEAISLGVPVVMTNVGCAGECVRTGVNGYVARTHTVQEIVEGLEAVLKNSLMYTKENLKKSLNNLQTQEEYIKILIQSFNKALL